MEYIFFKHFFYLIFLVLHIRSSHASKNADFRPSLLFQSGNIQLVLMPHGLISSTRRRWADKPGLQELFFFKF